MITRTRFTFRSIARQGKTVCAGFEVGSLPVLGKSGDTLLYTLHNQSTAKAAGERAGIGKGEWGNVRKRIG
jgi:hypothetical protein